MTPTLLLATGSAWPPIHEKRAESPDALCAEPLLPAGSPLMLVVGASLEQSIRDPNNQT